MRLLIAGGAGYIGSNMAAIALQRGHQVIVLDNLVKGHKEAVPQGAKLVLGNLGDREIVQRIFLENDVDAVMHFAAYSLVGESVKDPGPYFANNVASTQVLLDAMRERGVNRFIFSSTAATYGVPEEAPITEETPTRPINPYGESKLFVEIMLRRYAEAYGLRYTALRYFNAAGQANGHGEDHSPETHLIPNVLAVALGKREAVDIYGTDYPTVDGTAIRDYIHVADLADAHLQALEHTDRESGVFNLGTGSGYSVRQVVDVARDVTGHAIPTRDMARRPGDPPVLVASYAKARRVLGWTPRHSLRDMISSAWQWHQSHPDGFHA